MDSIPPGEEQNMREENVTRKEHLIFALMILLSLTIVIGEPEGPSFINATNTSTRVLTSAASIQAVAGNVTELSITGQTTTQSWQGYFGNITGQLILGDAWNHTLIDWDVTLPEGEVYVSTGTIDFSDGNIGCYDYESGESYFTLSELETSLGMNADDIDGVNETFLVNSSYPNFYAGTNQITGNCPMRQLNNISGTPSPDFYELLLYDAANQNLIYTAVLTKNGAVGFDNRTWNFQMIVGENGHEGDTTTTPYYFYAELNG